MPNWDDKYSNWLWREQPVAGGPTVVFDMDGVLSDASGRQHHVTGGRRDWDAFFLACGEDEVVHDVAEMLRLLDPSLRVVLLTARPIRVLPQTVDWLSRKDLPWDALIMRDFGDYSASRVFKRRTVDQLRSHDFDLRLAFEDDPRNVAMFRGVGVPCVYIHSGYYE